MGWFSFIEVASFLLRPNTLIITDVGSYQILKVFIASKHLIGPCEVQLIVNNLIVIIPGSLSDFRKFKIDDNQVIRQCVLLIRFRYTISVYIRKKDSV